MEARLAGAKAGVEARRAVRRWRRREWRGPRCRQRGLGPIEVKSLDGVPPRPGSVAGPAELLALFRRVPREHRRDSIAAVGEFAVRGVDESWLTWARPGQQPTREDWTVWVMMAGRGFGKTRAGAEWVSQKARETPDASIALVAATPEEARRVMIEGRSGIMACARSGAERRGMRWEPGIGQLTFASGAKAFVYSGAHGESLRGPEHHFAWCDELAKWRQAQTAWDNLILGLRAGERPQAVVTTTPRAIPALKAVLAIGGVEKTGGATRDNPHLAPGFVETVERLHGGTRLGRQELLGELIEDVLGSLWPRDLIERSRVAPVTGRGDIARVVIGVDPPASADGDECGIVVCGLREDGIGLVMADLSEGGLSPERWGRRVAAAAETWSADRIVAEDNQGGEMVESVLRGGVRAGIRRVHASLGKARRAEPVAACFERGEAKFAGAFPKLEDQLTGLISGGGYEGAGSPDRADAMVWATPAPQPQVRRL